MFFSALATAALAGSLVAAHPIHPSNFKANPHAKPAGWANSTLENYEVYHLRYVALDCRTQHNTTFFEDCCHPLKADQNLTEVAEPYCIPNATAIASASARIFTATATLTPGVAPTATVEDDANDTWVSVTSEIVASAQVVETSAAQAKTSVASPTPEAAFASPSSEAAQASPSPEVTPSSEALSADTASATSTSSSEVAPSSSTEVTPSPSPEVTPSPLSEAASSPSPSPSPAPQVQADQPQVDNHQDAPKETPTTTSEEAKPTPSEKPQENNNSAPSGNIQTGGQATFYSQAGTTGACGVKHGDNDLIVAASTDGPFYPDANGVSPYCGRSISIKAAGSFAGQGNTITAVIADACPTCHNSVNDLDLSKGAWAAMGIAESVGVVPIEWWFN